MQQSRDVAAKNCAAMEVPAAQCAPEALVSRFLPSCPGNYVTLTVFFNALRIMPMARPTNSACQRWAPDELLALRQPLFRMHWRRFLDPY
jgi:hypothetical protein